MHYVARVIAIFPEATSHKNRLDAWEAILTLRAAGARKALGRVISMSRSVFENPGNIKMLGYSVKPILYVVASISTIHPLQGTTNIGQEEGMVIVDMVSLQPQDVETLKARQHVSIPLHTVHIVSPD
jgi:hypothetical protein